MCNIENYKFIVESEYNVRIECLEDDGDYAVIGIKIDFDEECSPNPITIKWSISAAGAAAVWQPLGGQTTVIRPDWGKTQTPSRLASGMPIQVYHSAEGRNVMTVAVTDVKTPCVISSGLHEENSYINWELVLFSEPIAPTKHYENEIIIDRRKKPFYESIEDVRRIWAADDENKYVPDMAKQPLYSTWYSMHQELSADDLIEELKEAKKYGLENVIIDDGWQTEDNTRGYAFCGDWNVAESKMGKMPELTKRIHDIGMKCMLWFSIPFVGEYSNAYKRFENKFIKKITDVNDEKYTGVLDPRYPEVREYLIAIYEKAVREWKFDGLKLDFVDSIQFDGDVTVKDGMDIVSLEDAIEALMRDTYNRLLAINPDVMIEYRQGYVGPVMCKYSNMLRVADCPKSYITNRIGVISLRLTSGRNAVHSDMLMWGCDESAEDAALQIVNVLFSAIQVSMRLEKLPVEHKKMLKFYLDFAKANKHILLDVPLKIYQPEIGYGMVCAEADGNLMSVLYLPQPAVIDKAYEKVTVVNGTGDGRVIIDNAAEEFDAAVRIYDCTGESCETKMHIGKGVMSLDVPKAGVVEIVRA